MYLKKSLILLFIISLTVSFSMNEPATLQNYWDGEAEWELVNREFPALHAPKIKIVNSVWYKFFTLESGPLNEERLKNDSVTEYAWEYWVEKSLDGGETWTSRKKIIASEGEWNRFVSDGDFFYDEQEKKWRALFQCISHEVGFWRGCYLENISEDPTEGLFVETPHVILNPVLSTVDALWKDICDDGDDCKEIAKSGRYGRVGEAGTFQIIKKDNDGWFWIGFHGFDNPNGYRGVAKTKNFVDYVVDDASQGLPRRCYF